MSSTNFVVWGSDDNQSYGPTQRAREIGTQGVQAADPQGRTDGPTFTVAPSFLKCDNFWHKTHFITMQLKF